MNIVINKKYLPLTAAIIAIFLNLKAFKNSMCFQVLTLFFFIGNIGNTVAQEYKSKRPSPPKTAQEDFKGSKIAIDYSSPAVKWRKIWGGLVPYGEVWRTGANEATVITFSKAVKIEGNKLPAGKYALFSIPENGKWTIIFNKQHKQWGAFKYNKKEDILRIKVKSGTTKKHTERMLFEITKRTSEKGTVNFFWEKIKISFDFELVK